MQLKRQVTLAVPAAGTSGHFLKHDGTFGQVAYSDLSGAPSGVGGAAGVDFNDDVKARFGTETI